MMETLEKLMETLEELIEIFFPSKKNKEMKKTKKPVKILEDFSTCGVFFWDQDQEIANLNIKVTAGVVLDIIAGALDEVIMKLGERGVGAGNKVMVTVVSFQRHNMFQ